MKNFLTCFILAAIFAALTTQATAQPQSKGGFDLSTHAIAPEEISGGGPGKDGIPSLSEPQFIEADKAGHVSEEEFVIGVALGGEAKAYPVRILSWHEAVNDRLGGSPILTTW